MGHGSLSNALSVLVFVCWEEEKGGGVLNEKADYFLSTDTTVHIILMHLGNTLQIVAEVQIEWTK